MWFLGIHYAFRGCSFLICIQAVLFFAWITLNVFLSFLLVGCFQVVTLHAILHHLIIFLLYNLLLCSAKFFNLISFSCFVFKSVFQCLSDYDKPFNSSHHLLCYALKTPNNSSSCLVCSFVQLRFVLLALQQLWFLLFLDWNLHCNVKFSDSFDFHAWGWNLSKSSDYFHSTFVWFFHLLVVFGGILWFYFSMQRLYNHIHNTLSEI